MWFIRTLLNATVFASLALGILSGCGGALTGSLSDDFAGVSSAVALSPTSVKLSWSKDEKVREYQVYEIQTPSPIQTSVFDNAIIEGLEPDTEYTFKVVGNQDDKSAGIDREIKVKTWPQFEGVVTLETVSETSILVKWDYAYTPLNYLVYVKEGEVPTAANTGNWETYTAKTQQKSYLITNVKPSKTYHVVVQAEYKSGEFERVLKSISLTSETTFKTPIYKLSTISIGALPLLTVSPVVDETHQLSGYKSQAFWKGQPVSDPLIGAGTVVFSANAGLPIGKVDGISLKVTYGSGASEESLIIDNLTTYIKGVPELIETPAQLSGLPQGSSYFGKALARGDFNCDGADDLAIGAPDISIVQFGNTRPSTGAVFIYYSEIINNDNDFSHKLKTTPAPQRVPLNKGKDPQIITFDDLLADDNFGFTLAAGNMNGDNENELACDDLAVGMPNRDPGEVVVLFGSVVGLKSSSRLADLPINTGTCDGKVSGAACTATRLIIDHSLVPPSIIGGAYEPFGNPTTKEPDNTAQFGASLAFIGDFDSNGYEDLAVGAPSASLPGELPNIGTNGGYLDNVGFVTIYYGSKFGVGTVNLSPTETLRYTTIYPPIIESQMKFGSSIAGGADVDGSFRVKDPVDGIVKGGSDLIVGAPGFTYSNYTDTNKNYGKSAGPTASSFFITPESGGWNPNLSELLNFYGWPQNSNAEVGTAFLYYGLAAINSAGASENKTSWLACGSRGFANPTEHYSCFARSTGYSVLFPLEANARGFGSSVAMVGNPSRFKDGSTDNILLTDTPADANEAFQFFSDANGDGFADVIVGAPGSRVNNKAEVGALYQFFGNPNRLFGYNNLRVGVAGDPADDYTWSNPTCTTYSGAGQSLICKPSILTATSFLAYSRIGASSTRLAVNDVTGDGLKDLVVGVPEDNTTGTNSGSVIVFPSIQGAGLGTSFKKFYSEATTANDRLGYSVTAGNFNGDKNVYQPPLPRNPTNRPFGDIFAGAPFDGSKTPAVGTVVGFMTSGLALPAVMSNSSNGLGGSLILNETVASFQRYGLGETTIVGDVNGDGYDDAVSKVVTTLSDGSKQIDAVVYFGSQLGLLTTQRCLENMTDVFVSGVTNTDFCYPQASPEVGVTLNDIALPQRIPRPPNLPLGWHGKANRVGDVNADGFDDVVFISSTPMAPGNVGLVVLYFGARGGILNVVDPSFNPSIGDPQIVTTRISFSGGGYGAYYSDFDSFYQRNVVASADFNGDGYNDVIIGEPLKDSEPMNPPGSTENMLRGSETGVAAGGGWNCGPTTNDQNCIRGVGIQEHGRIYVIYGSPLGYQTPAVKGLTSTDFLTDTDPGMLNLLDTEASSAAKPCTDPESGPADCKMTFFQNPQFENIAYGYSFQSARFGATVATMRVDKDSFPDVLVGAPDFTDIACNQYPDPNSLSHYSDYGRIFILYGTNRGVVASERDDYYAWTRTGPCPADPTHSDPDIGDPSQGILPFSRLRALVPAVVSPGSAYNRADRLLGETFSVVGDVNNDSFEDLLITLPEERVNFGSGAYNAPGTAYLFYGPICPMDNHPLTNDWFQSDGVDVGDGTTNNINIQTYYPGAAPIGSTAPTFLAGTSLPEGVKATCYRSDTLGIKPIPLKFSVLGGEVDDRYGWAYSSAKAGKGDVNGDGFDDVLLGSYLWDNTVDNITNVGQGVIFFGHQDGLSVEDYPTLSLSKNTKGLFRPLFLNPFHQENSAEFFRGNVTTGDVNGDETADYMITSRYFNGSGATGGVWIGTFFLFY